MRCLYLVRELGRRTAVEPVFMMRAFPNGARWVEQQAYPVVLLPPEAHPETEVARLRELLEARRPDCVMTDLRDLTPGLIETVKAHGILSVTIDEWGGRTIRSDILTNGTIVPSWHQYRVEGEVRCYIGPPYALLDPAFAQAKRPKDSLAHALPRILVALGGDDPFFLTVKAMRALERIPTPLSLTVAIGPAFTDAADIRRLAASSRHRYEVCECAANMAELMGGADVAITAGGLVALEIAACGTPGVILCEVPHQLETAQILQQHGAAVNLGFGVAVSEEEIARVVAELIDDERRRMAMARTGPQLIDGQGCVRIADAILSALSLRGVPDDRSPAGLPLGR
jgi:spore coat polysaccharide biosynthesis protein SpsF